MTSVGKISGFKVFLQRSLPVLIHYVTRVWHLAAHPGSEPKMSLITVLRPALASDCEHIYTAHRYAVQYTCEQSYDRRVLTAWSALLRP